MFFHKTPGFLHFLFPDLIWKINDSGQSLYLTFDDGPIPSVTDWVLDCLKEYNVKATFFCVGDNIQKYPDVYNRILEDGHSPGNHTYNHLDGWSTSKKEYLTNIEFCQRELSNSSNLFRPPHGRINRKALNEIKSRYKVIMWDVLIGDYRKDLNVEMALKKSLRVIEKGSIVLFHDSFKSERNMKYILPKFIEGSFLKGYRFRKFQWS